MCVCVGGGGGGGGEGGGEGCGDSTLLKTFPFSMNFNSKKGQFYPCRVQLPLIW